jgi:hypothetical protein
VDPASAQKSEDEELAEIKKAIEKNGYHWTAGKTSVSGLTFEEKRRLCGHISPPEWVLENMPLFVPPGDSITDNIFDWRDYNCVTAAKSQDGCGSCWAFAAVGELESHMLVYDGRYEDLSEQMILSCVTTSSGCDGGFAVDAYKVFMEQGIVTEACMPYEADDQIPCNKDRCTIFTGVIGYERIRPRVDDIKAALLRGPVSTSFDVYTDFYYYEEGCYENAAGGEKIGSHAVIIVGWYEYFCGGQGAWLCKNSWGEDWGMDGFFFIKYDCCGIGSNTTQLMYGQSTVIMTLGFPNGGESFVVGSECCIKWITDRHCPTPDAYNIYLSTDKGALYSLPVVEGLDGGSSFLWKIPSVPSIDGNKLLVQAIIADTVAGMDTSDDVFAIMPDYEWPEVTVLYPNGGEVFEPGDTICIDWIATDNAGIDSINVYYSEYESYIYIPIAVGEELEPPYCWVIPDGVIGDYVIKITAYDPSLQKDTDFSDAAFSIDQTGTGDEPEGPAVYANRLEQNYPNPFNGTTTIAYSVAERCDVVVGIYDTAGKLVRIIERRAREPGRYETVWRGTDTEGRAVASGVYFCSIDAGGFRDSRKIVYLR